MINILGKEYEVEYGRELPNISDSLLSIDIETTYRLQHKNSKYAGLTPELSRIRLMSLYAGGSFIGVLDFFDKDGSYLLQDVDFVSKLQDFLLNNRLVAHNALFELSHLQRVFQAHFGKVKPLTIMCTMNAFRLFKHAVDDEPNKYKDSLKDVAKTILGYDMQKDMQKSDWSQLELTKEQIEYSSIDAVVPYLLAHELLPKLDELEMSDVFLLNTQAQEPLAHMRINGIKFDNATHDLLIQDWKEKASSLQNRCKELLNITKLQELDTVAKLKEMLVYKVVSNKREWLLDTLGLVEIVNSMNDMLVIENKLNAKLAELMLSDDTKNNTASKRAVKRALKNIEEYFVSPDSNKDKSNWFKDNLDIEDLSTWESSEKTDNLKVNKNVLSLNTHIPMAKELNEYSKYAKLLSTYGASWKEFIVDEMIYPNFTLCQTGTGRMSSYSPNMQQLPRTKSIRSLFTKRSEDRKLLCADYSQVELRVGAEISQDEVMLDAYLNGKDLHRITASNLAGCREDEVSKEDRQKAKGVNFGLAYGAGGATLKKYSKISYGVDMSDEEALQAVATYRTTYPDYRKWQLKQTSEVAKTLKVRTPLGKLRLLKEEEYYCTCVNTPIQGGAGEIMLKALYRLWLYIQEHDVDAFIVNVVHDEILVDCHNDNIEEMKQAIENCMVAGYLDIFPNGEATTRGLVEVGVGNNWAEAK